MKHCLPKICDLQFLTFTIHLSLLKSFLFIAMYTSTPSVTRWCHSIKWVCMPKTTSGSMIRFGAFSVASPTGEDCVNLAIIVNLSTFTLLFAYANNYLCVLLELVMFCANNFFKLICCLPPFSDVLMNCKHSQILVLLFINNTEAITTESYYSIIAGQFILAVLCHDTGWSFF